MANRRQFLTLGALALAAAACSESPSKSENGLPALRVGMDLTYPPFEMLDTSGRPAGVSVELAEALAIHLGRELRLVPMDFSGLIPALQTGNIDVVISSMTATPERARTIDFSDPYAFTGLALLVAKTSDIRSVEDLKSPGRTITAKLATTSETWAIEQLPSAKRVIFEDPAACVMEVTQGRADAFIYDQLSIFQYARQNPETTRGLLQPFVEESWAIGLAKGNNTLRTEINAFITAFRAEDGFGKLGEKYLKDEKAFLDAAGIPFILR